MHRTNSNLETTLAQQQRSRVSSGTHDTPSTFSFERSVVRRIYMIILE